MPDRPPDDGLPVRTDNTHQRRVRWLAPAVLAVVAVIAGLVGALIALAVHDDSAPATEQATPAGTGTGRATAAERIDPDWRAVASRVGPGVVEITVQQTVTAPGPPGAPDQNQEQVALGSGFVIGADGSIVTNAHVVNSAKTITVHFADGATATAKFLGADPTTDLAVVRATGAAVHLHPLALGPSSSLRVGDPVMAMGTPFGYAGSASVGVVSGLGREIPSLNGYTLSDAVQTDAAVNHGNSGGPLLDAAGAVVAVVAQIADSGVDANVGVAFAIPLDSGNRAVIDELRSTGKVSHAWLGIAGATIDQGIAAAGSLATTSGVLVTGIATGSPADAAGLVAGTKALALDVSTVCVGGDAIVALNGTPVTSMDDLQNQLEALKPGSRAALSLVRAGGKRETVTVTLGTQPEAPPDITLACS
jgi:S1-C subfamily serine protease